MFSNLKPDHHVAPGGDFNLQEWPFYWLIKAHSQYQASMETALREIGLDIPRWRVLLLLEKDTARSISYLAKEAFTKLSTMTRIIQRMQDDALVISRQRASDQRVSEVLLTALGKEARVKAIQQADAIIEKSFVNLGHEDIVRLNNILATLHQNLSQEV